MRSSYQIIDDQGRVWHEHSLVLRADNSGLVAGEGFIDYAIRNMGFIALRQVEGNALELRLRLDGVSEAAFIAASYLLWDRAPSRIVLAHWTEGKWQFELHLGLGTLMARLSRSGSVSRSRQKRTLNAERSLESLQHSDKFREIMLEWQAARPGANDAGFMARLAELSNNRYIVYEKDPLAGFRVAGFGTNQPEFALKWLGSSESTLVRHPDIEYAWACERSFSAAIERDVAILEEIDAFVRWQSGAQEMPLRRKYQRLLLPLLGGSRSRLVSITRENPAIDLRAGGVSH